MNRKHQDKVARLPPQGDTRATFHPLVVFTTGGSIGDATWDTIKGWKASFSPGAFDLMMRREFGGM
jgi:predicted RNA-binding protein with TRAM domain